MDFVKQFWGSWVQQRTYHIVCSVWIGIQRLWVQPLQKAALDTTVRSQKPWTSLKLKKNTNNMTYKYTWLYYTDCTYMQSYYFFNKDFIWNYSQLLTFRLRFVEIQQATRCSLPVSVSDSTGNKHSCPVLFLLMQHWLITQHICLWIFPLSCSSPWTGPVLFTPPRLLCLSWSTRTAENKQTEWRRSAQTHKMDFPPGVRMCLVCRQYPNLI